MRLGADADALDELARSLVSGARRMERLRVDVDRAVRSAFWTGADAERFRARWSTDLTPRVRGMGVQLERAGADARRHAAEQRRASAAALPPVPVLESGPSRIRIVTAAGSGGARLGVDLEHVWRVEDLEGGRVRVDEMDRVAIGLGASAGSSVHIGHGGHDGDVAVPPSVFLGAGGGVGRTWEIPERDLTAFLEARVVDLASGGRQDEVAAVVGMTPIAAVLGAVGVGRGFTYEMPRPDRTRVEVGVSGQGEGAVTYLGSGSGAATAAITAEVDHSTGSTRYRIEGSLVAAATVEIGAATGTPAETSGSVDIATSATLTVDRSGRATRLDLEQTEIDGDHWTRRRSSLDLTDPQVRDAASQLLDGLRGGNGSDGGIERPLRELVVATAAGGVTVDVYRIVSDEELAVSTPFVSGSLQYEELRRVRSERQHIG